MQPDMPSSVGNDNLPTATEIENSIWSLPSLVLVLIIMSLLLWSGLLFFSNSSLRDDKEALETTLARLETQQGEVQSQASLGTKESFLESKRAKRMLWTNVLNRLFETNPTNSESGENLVTYKSISGSNNGDINLAVKTRSGAADAYRDTAILLREFNRKPFYKDLFIPNIASTLSQLGVEVLNYNLRLRYLAEEDPINDLAEPNLDQSGVDQNPENESEDNLIDTDGPNDEQINSVVEQLRNRLEAENNTDLTQNDNE